MVSLFAAGERRRAEEIQSLTWELRETRRRHVEELDFYSGGRPREFWPVHGLGGEISLEVPRDFSGATCTNFVMPELAASMPSKCNPSLGGIAAYIPMGNSSSSGPQTGFMPINGSYHGAGKIPTAINDATKGNSNGHVGGAILATRRRDFGNRHFRFWVEDLAAATGARVHAMGEACGTHTYCDVSDAHLSTMLAGYRRSKQSHADASVDVDDFLHALLGAAFLVDASQGRGGAGTLELRLPNEVLAMGQGHLPATTQPLTARLSERVADKITPAELAPAQAHALTPPPAHASAQVCDATPDRGPLSCERASSTPAFTHDRAVGVLQDKAFRSGANALGGAGRVPSLQRVPQQPVVNLQATAAPPTPRKPPGSSTASRAAAREARSARVARDAAAVRSIPAPVRPPGRPSRPCPRTHVVANHPPERTRQPEEQDHQYAVHPQQYQQPQRRVQVRPQSAPHGGSQNMSHRRPQSARSSGRDADRMRRSEYSPIGRAQVIAPERARGPRVRPISAKMSKHRRVLDDGFDPTIYEDLDEDADELSEQLSVSVTCEKGKGRIHGGTGGCGSCNSSVRGSMESHSLPISRPTSAVHAASRAGSPQRVESRPSSATSNSGTLVPDDMVELLDDDDHSKELVAEDSETCAPDSTMPLLDDTLLDSSGTGYCGGATMDQLLGDSGTPVDCLCTAIVEQRITLSPRLPAADIPLAATGLSIPSDDTSTGEQDLATFADSRQANPLPAEVHVVPRSPPATERLVSSSVMSAGLPSVDCRLGRGPGASSPPPRKSGMPGAM